MGLPAEILVYRLKILVCWLKILIVALLAEKVGLPAENLDLQAENFGLLKHPKNFPGGSALGPPPTPLTLIMYSRK